MRLTPHWMLAALALSTTALVIPAHAEYAEAWRVEGYAMPESVVYDEAGGAIFVTNINSPDQSSNGQGYVTKANPDGSIVTEKFTDGLNAPRGIDMANGRLYVGQNGEVIEIDATSGEVVARHAVENGLFNDVLALPDGRVLITETMTGSIYVIDGEEFSQWLADPALTGANGLLLVDGQVLVASIGDLSKGFANIKPANIKSVNLETKEITDFGTADPLGNLDGLSSLPDGSVLVSDNFTGDLIKVSADGTHEIMANAGPGAADQDNVGNVVVVPVIQSNALVAFTVE
jgi:glucose/arabinose dehydrogenase